MHNVNTLETPVAIVDLDRLKRNLDRVASYAKEHRLALRPHIKTHKSLMVASEQLRRGAVGLTCATPFEAETMSEVADDILVAYPPIGDARVNRLLALPEHVRLKIALDSAEAVHALATVARRANRTVGVYVELDVGMHRVGLPNVDDAIALARVVRDNPPLEFAGIAFYPGHVRESVDAQDAKLADVDVALRRAVERVDQA